MATNRNFSTKQEKGKQVLPKHLSKFDNSDFGIQQRVRFLYYLCFALIAGVTIIIFYTGILQVSNPIYGKLYFPVLIPEFLILLIVIACLTLLIKGHFTYAAHILIGSTFCIIWFGMLMDRGESISRLDGIVFVIGILTMLPLLVINYRRAFLFYVVANILFLFIFIGLIRDQLNVSQSTIIDYLADSSIVLTFVGIVSYTIFRINKQSLERAVSDINERIETEKALIAVEAKFKEITDMLPQTVFESDLNGNLTYLNKTGLDVYGFTLDDVKNGINVFTTISLNDREKAAKNIQLTMRGEPVNDNHYDAIKKDGTTFPVQIFSRPFEVEGQLRGLRGIVIDITEQIKADRALKESQRLFQSIAQMSPVGIFRTKADGYTTYVNPRWTQLSGLSFDEALGDGWLNAVHPDDKDSLIRKWAVDSNVGTTSIAEYRFLRTDGTIVWVLGDAIPEIENDEIKGYIGTITDITEIKLAQEKIAKSEKRFRDMSDLLPQSIWEADIKGNVSFLNKYGLDLYGYTQEDLNRGINIISTLVEEDKKRAGINIKRRINGETPSSKFEEYTSIKKDGSTFPIQVYVSPIMEDQVPVGLRGITFDMTAIKRAQNDLKESEKKYRTLMESMNEVIIMADNDHVVQFVNSKFTELLGYTPQEIIGKVGYKMLHDPEDLKVVEDANLKRINKIQSHYELTFKAKDGRKYDFLVSGAPVQNQVGDTIGSIGTMIDITEKKIIEKELENYRNNLEHLVNERTEELAAANEELTSTNEELYYQRKELEAALNNLQAAQKQLLQAEKMASLGVMSAGVAHEINNPLNFINGGVLGIENYFHENLTDHIENVSPLIEAIKTGVSRAADIVKSLNRYSRQTESKNEKCDLHSVIDGCLVIIQGETKNRIIIEKNFTTDIFTIFGNEGKLHQAILNVLTNALHAIDNEGRIRISTIVSNGAVELTIHDSGHGIGQEDINKIFDPFFTTKDPGKGTGLGLTITYQILQEFNGTIEYISEKGNGTTAKIMLPIEQKI
jgi:PAS domain S-box-containing protein